MEKMRLLTKEEFDAIQIIVAGKIEELPNAIMSLTFGDPDHFYGTLAALNSAFARLTIDAYRREEEGLDQFEGDEGELPAQTVLNALRVVDNAPEDNWLNAGASYVHEDEPRLREYLPGIHVVDDEASLEDLMAALEEIADDEFEED